MDGKESIELFMTALSAKKSTDENERLRTDLVDAQARIKALTDALREALAGVNKYTGQMERLQAVLEQYGTHL
jgi:chromosome segregation ATPase